MENRHFTQKEIPPYPLKKNIYFIFLIPKRKKEKRKGYGGRGKRTQEGFKGVPNNTDRRRAGFFVRQYKLRSQKRLYADGICERERDRPENIVSGRKP